MISFFLSCVHQTHDRICAYPVIILSYSYPAFYHILSLSYPAHQTNPKLRVYLKFVRSTCECCNYDITNFCSLFHRFGTVRYVHGSIFNLEGNTKKQ
jgi:hypothetical protein